MSQLNGPQKQQLPEHQVPTTLEPAQMLTATQQAGAQKVVTLVINKAGTTFSLQLLPDDAVKWGEQLTQAGRHAQSGLVL